ncbi:MAG: discoidin domain-containing protein [Prevotella sp.]|nr:discoidin domain-containing protein [Prevotella sp.]
MRKLIIMSVLMLTASVAARAQEAVQVGRGSYAAYTPLAKSRTAEHGGDQSQYMQYRKLYIKEQAGRPIPTNDWWTDMINADRGRSGQELTGHLWSYPQYVQGMKYGVDVHYPKYWIDNGTEMKAQSKLRISGGDDFAARQPLAEEWSDWTVGFSLLPQGAADFASADASMLVTLAHGVPFTWIETKGISPVITVVKTGNDGAENRLTGKTTVKLTDASGAELTSGACNRFVVGIGSADAYETTADLYGVYLPDGATVSVEDGEARVTFGSGPQFVVVALLKQTADLNTYAPYAYSKPVNTEVSWNYTQATGTLTTHWQVTANDLRTGTATTDVLQGFIPHQYRNGATPAFTFNGQHYRTPRGMLKLAAGADLSVSYRFSGMLPWYALPVEGSGTGTYDPAKMLQMLERYAQTGEFGGDTYWGGKGLTQMALYMTFAREMGEEAMFRQTHDRLKEALVDWLTYTPGESNFFFARDNRFGGLIGYETSYDSDTYNDHHFHYGYYTLAAAMLCMVDDDFKAGYGEMLKLIARDYNNYKRDDWSCFLRMMDPWAGHCYAGGLGDGAGNGQESTSESMQSWGGMYLLGVALGDDELRDAGIFGWVSESRATAEYWFDRHGESIGADFHTATPDYDAADVDNLYNIDYQKFVHRRDGVVDYVQPWSSNLTSHGIGWWTWFGGDPVFMQGIQWMPISPALDYLGEDKAFAAWDYDRLMALKEHVGWEDYSGTDAWLGNSDWGNVVLSYRQWSDPDDAAAIFDEGWAKGWGTMTTSSTNGITYFVTHSHRTYGDIVWDVTASIPTARVYIKDGVKTHMAFNPTDEAVTVSFSDGASLTVPARQLKVEGVESTAYNYVYPVDDSEPDLRERLVMKNLALNKTCTESSHENDGSVAQNATDGSLDTRWGSAHQDNEWLQVDLGENATIYKTKIRWEAAYASEYRIELRNTPDGAVTYSKTGTGKPNDWTELTLDDQPGRYVRVVGVKRGTQYGTSLYELEVYGRLASTLDADLMGVEITSAKSVLKQGEPTVLTIQGYNYAKQPKTVGATWSSSDGTFSGNEFTPTKYGNVSVTAAVSGMTATKTLPVEEALQLTSVTIEMEGDPVIGHAVSFTAEGRDQFGAPYASAALSYELYEDVDGEQIATTHATLDTDAMTFTAHQAGNYVIVVKSGALRQTVNVRGIGPTGISYEDIPAVAAAPSMSGKLPLFVGQTEPSGMNFDYNGGSLKGTDNFPVPTIGGGTTRALFVSQLGTFGFGALGNMDISDYNMIHADIYVVNNAPAFSFHFEGLPANKEYAKSLTKGQWNSVDLPVTNTTVNWLFFAFSNYQAGTNEALIANVYFYKESGDRVFVSDPDARGLVTVTSFGTGITDANKEAFLADIAALPATATAIDLSNITLSNTTPMTISTPNNPNTVLLLQGAGGDDNAASDQTARLTNTQNLAYDAGGWILPLKATDYQIVFQDGYPVYPANYGGRTKFTYSRTVAAGAYGTLCMPREMDIPTGITVYELSSATAAGLEFTQLTGTKMEAYKPYLIRNTGSTAMELRVNGTQGNVELARTAAQLTTTVDNVRFVGNFAQFQVTGSEGYAAFKGNGQLAWLNNEGTTVGAFRAYLADVPEGARVYVDGTTGVDLNPTLTQEAETWYDLQGRRLGSKPTRKGIYIRNGRTVVVK